MDKNYIVVSKSSNYRTAFFKEKTVINGFVAKIGFIGFLNEDNEFFGFTSGKTKTEYIKWHTYRNPNGVKAINYYFVYYLVNGKWEGEWEEDLDGIISHAIDAFEEWFFCEYTDQSKTFCIDEWFVEIPEIPDDEKWEDYSDDEKWEIYNEIFQQELYAASKEDIK